MAVVQRRTAQGLGHSQCKLAPRVKRARRARESSVVGRAAATVSELGGTDDATQPSRHRSRRVTPLTLSDTDPAELAVDAIVIGLHTSATGDGGRRCSPPGAESVAVAFDGQAGRDAGACSARPARAGEVTKLATLGTVIGPGDRRGRARPGPTGADAAPRRCAGRPRRRSGRWPARPRWRWRCRRPTAPTAQAPAPCGRSPRARCSARTGSPATRPSRSRAGATRSGARAARAGRRRQGREGRGEAGRRGRGRGRPYPRLGQHRAQRAAPADVRRPRSRRRPAQAGLEVEVLDEKALQARAGTAASSRSAWARRRRRGWSASATPRRARARKVALVGKGITFDTGGFAIKPAAGHVGDEVRHGRRGRGRRRPWSRSPRSSRRWPSPRTCRWPRT